MDEGGDSAVGVEGKILGLTNLTVGAAVFRFMLEVDTELAGAPKHLLDVTRGWSTQYFYHDTSLFGLLIFGAVYETDVSLAEIMRGNR